jgi:hypothetical protein
MMARPPSTLQRHADREDRADDDDWCGQGQEPHGRRYRARSQLPSTPRPMGARSRLRWRCSASVSRVSPPPCRPRLGSIRERIGRRTEKLTGDRGSAPRRCRHTVLIVAGAEPSFGALLAPASDRRHTRWRPPRVSRPRAPGSRRPCPCRHELTARQRLPATARLEAALQPGSPGGRQRAEKRPAQSSRSWDDGRAR